MIRSFSARRVVLLALIAPLVFCVPFEAFPGDGSDDLSFYSGEVLQAGYVQNRLGFDGLRFVWSVTHEQTENYRLHLQKSADFAEQLSKKTSFTDDQRTNFKKSADELRKSAAAFQPKSNKSEPLEYWIHDNAVQIRRCLESTARFSDEFLTKESLVSTFRNVGIYSFRGTGARWVSWTGQSNVRGAIIDDVPPFSHDFPPLLPATTITTERLHPFDRFFSGDPSSLKVIGFEKLDSIRLVVVERIQEARPEEFLSAGRLPELRGRIRKELITRAWIDPAAGCLPRRIYDIARYFRDDEELPYPLTFREGLRPIVDVIRIEKTPNGGYFPVAGKITEWMIAGGPIPHSIEQIVDGQPPIVVSLTPMSFTTWRAENVAARQVTEFDLQAILPEGTVVHDAASKQMMVQDQVGGLVRASVEQLKTESPVRPWPWRWITGGVFVFSLGIYTSIRFYRRRR